jgi:hypothetical protein
MMTRDTTQGRGEGIGGPPPHFLKFFDLSNLDELYQDGRMEEVFRYLNSEINALH